MEMKIDADKLVEFLSKIYLEGLVQDCVISVKEGGAITTRGLDIAKAIYFGLKSKAKVKEPGELLVGDIHKFQQVIRRFSGDIVVTCDDKFIIVKQSRKKGRFAIPKKKDIDSYAKSDAIKIKKDKVVTPHFKTHYKSNWFVLDAEELSSLVKDADVLDEHIYILIAKDDGLNVRIKKDRNIFASELTVDPIKLSKEMEASFGHGIKEIFNSVEGSVKLFLEPKSNAMLIRFGKGYRNVYLVTKRSDQ